MTHERVHHRIHQEVGEPLLRAAARIRGEARRGRAAQQRLAARPASPSATIWRSSSPRFARWNTSHLPELAPTKENAGRVQEAGRRLGYLRGPVPRPHAPGGESRSPSPRKSSRTAAFCVARTSPTTATAGWWRSTSTTVGAASKSFISDRERARPRPGPVRFDVAPAPPGAGSERGTAGRFASTDPQKRIDAFSSQEIRVGLSTVSPPFSDNIARVRRPGRCRAARRREAP